MRDEGIQYHAGEQLVIHDPVTGQILNSDELENDLDFDIDTFNRKVITENFNRAVLAEIANDLNPDGESKTLIYAVDDNHAEMIVAILREIYSNNKVCMQPSQWGKIGFVRYGTMTLIYRKTPTLFSVYSYPQSQS